MSRSQPIKTIITGATGRMGRMLLQAVLTDPQFELCGAIAHQHDPLLAIDAGALVGLASANTSITANLVAVIEVADVVIDFTTPDACVEHVALCQQYHKKIVIGTTGLSVEQQAFLHQAAQNIAIVWAPNMSIGVNLLFKLLEQAAQTLGEQADIEIIEAHHRNKVDAPSGTALKMGQVIADVLERDLASCAIYGREGQEGSRKTETIGFSTIRAGDIIGDHTALFACAGERIEITHKASDRTIYSRGALKAAHYLMTKTNGFYTMQHVLNL